MFAGALAFVLLGFAALLAAPQTAHAVDKEIWSATLTAAASSTSTEFGYERAQFGTLSSEGPLPGLQTDIGPRYVYSLTNDHGILGGTLQLTVDFEGTGRTDPLENTEFRARLTLDLDTSSFSGGTYASIPNSVKWLNSGLTWTAGQMIAVSLKLDVPGISSIAFTSSPTTGTTYDTGESVTATVTFDEAVDVTGTPQLTINMGGSDKVLDYSSGTGTTALVFTGYTVAFGDTDTDGLSIAADKLDLNGGTIKATADENPDAVLTHTAVAASASHKVSGTTAPPAPTVSSIVFNSAGSDGAFKTGDAVVASVTFSEAVTVDTTGGTPQLTISMGGTDKVLDYASGTGTVTLHFSGYTVAANDEDTDGLSIEANKLDANGGTIQKTADTSVAAVLTHAAEAASANHKVDGVKPTLVTTGDNAPRTSLDGSQIILVFSEDIGSVDRANIAVKSGTTAKSTKVSRKSGSRVEITLADADVLTASDTMVTVALAADAVTDVPGNGIAAVSATTVIRARAPGAPVLTAAAKTESIELSWTVADHGTSDITHYDYRIKETTGGTYTSWTDTRNGEGAVTSNSGGSVTLTRLTNGTQYTVQVQGVNSDGEGADSNEPTATPDAPPAVGSVAITSDPGADKTYIIGDDIEFTVTFDKNLTVAGAQISGTAAYIEFLTDYAADTPGEEHPEPNCAIGTDTKTLVCTETVLAGWYDNDGIAVAANRLADNFAQTYVVGPLNQRANLAHSALPADSNHKVDGVKPTLSSAAASSDLTKVVLSFSEALTETPAPATGDFTLNVDSGTAPTIDSVAIDGRDVTLSLSAAVDTSNTYTIDYTAGTNPIKDLPGNAAEDISGQSVSVEDTTAPTLTSANTYTVGGSTGIALDFSETIDANSIPATSAFEVKIQGTAVGVDSVARATFDTDIVSLALDANPRPGDTITVSYTKPGTHPLKDAANNEVASFTDQAVANTLAATAPEKPSFTFAANNGFVGEILLGWSRGWDNGSPIEKHQYRFAAGSSIPPATTYIDIPDSAPGEENDGGYVVTTGLEPGTTYLFEIRAVNGIGPGGPRDAVGTPDSPEWSFTLQDSNGDAVTQLTEGGASATATVSITNGVTFSTDQTVTLAWGGGPLTGSIQGPGRTSTLTILANESSGSLEISSPNGFENPPLHYEDETYAFAATHEGTQIGSIDLTRIDDEPVPKVSITQAPVTVDEGDSIQIRMTMDPAAGQPRNVNLTVTDASSALTGTLPSRARISTGQASELFSLTAAENMTQDDGAREVVFALKLNPDTAVYTLGTPSSVTITVRDDDTPPLAPRNLAAQAGDTEATLRWDAPAASSPDHGQPVLRYEYRVKTTGSFGSWTTVPGSDADTRSHTFTGLSNDQEHTYQVRAVNVAGGGASVEKSVTPIEGIAVSFAAAVLTVDEGDDATVTVTLATAPAAGVTVPLVATPGTGLDSTEYSGVPMNVTFDAGDISKSFTVTAVDDTDDEPDRLLTFSFGTLPEGYVPGTHETLALTVADNDVPIVSASFGAAASVQEGTSVPVTVRLSQAPEREVVLPLVATRGAGLTVGEHEAVPASVTFTENAIEARFTLKFEDDAVEEGNETLTLTFGTYPDRVQAGTNTRLTLTVTDDDGPPLAPDVSVQTGDGFAVLSWPAVQNDSPVLRYEVRWRESDDGTFGDDDWQSVGLVTSYRVEGLTNGKAHEFQVRAVNAHGTDEDEIASAPGTPSQVITNIPTAVQGLWVKATDSARAELSWGQPANATDEDHSSNPNSMMSQLQGYRIEVCRTACGDETNWYALVPNTGKFEHRYTHQVLAPGVIRENRYRVRAININGKTGPWSNVATLDPTEVRDVYLQTPNDSTLWVRFRVRNPDGNLLYVRYKNTATGTVGHAEYRLTKKQDGVKLVLSGLDAGSWYKVELDFNENFDSPRRGAWWYGTAKQGHTPLTSPYAKDLLDAQVFRGGQWREAPDNELYVRMGGTGKYRVRLKPCGSIYNVRSVRIQAPAGRLRASPTDTDPSLFTNLNCEVEQDGWRTDENGNRLTLGDVYDMTNFPAHANDHIPIYAGTPNNWHEVTVTARALEDYPVDTRADALLSAPFAVVYNHAVWYGSHDTRSGPVSEGTGLVRISLDRPADAVLPEPAGVTIADPVAGGFGNPVMSWDAVDGAWGYKVEWRHGLRYSNRANQDRSLQAATSVTLPLGASRRGPITARVRAYSGSGVSGWVERTWDSRAPTLNVFDTAVNEADGSVGFLVKLSPAASGTVTVDYTTVDDTAVAPADYTATSGTLTFAPGQREKKTPLVPIVDDGEEDSGETFRLVLSNPTGSDANNGAAVIADAEAVATILNSEQEAAELTGFTLVDAGTNGDLMALAEGSTVRLGDLLASSYGIRAEMSPGAAPGSVRLELSGAKTAAVTDDAAPWSLYGDGAGRINGGSLPPGSYTLTATAYADSGGRGEERGSLEVSFTVAAGALGVTTPGPFAVAEGETDVTALAASDTGTGGRASWSIPAGTAGGADGAAFALTAEGVLTLVAAKDFEAPDDADGDGVYEVTVEVREGVQSATAALSVTLSDVDEAPLAVTTQGPFTVAEGETAVAELAASGTGTGATASWSIPEGTAGGADGAAFAVTPEGVLTLVAAKDFEAPDDADGDGTWEVTVAVAVPATVMAGAQSATAALLVTLANANEAPVAQAAASPARVREGAEVTLDGSASADPDAGDTLSHAWTQDRDGAARVVLSDANAAQPVFTSPSDLAAETELGFTLKVTDAAGLHAEATVTVTVTLVSEVSVAAASGYVAEGADAVFRLTRAGSARAALTVPVTVEETGAMLGADVPKSATFAAGVRETELRVPTAADAVSENDSRVTMRLGSGSGWQLAPDAASASLTVLDDDVAPSVSAADVTVWSADMTVVEYGPRSIGAGTAAQFSNQMGRAGLRAKRLWYDPTERKLRIGFDGGLDDAELLTLHMGAVSVGFPANSGGDSSFTLENVDLDWTDGETLAVRVSKPSAVAVSTDATLASLSVDGATLSPAFDAGVLVYRAVADAETQTVTLAATANDGGASVAYGPAGDADTALADHQVAVPGEGETLVEVTVTAADGTVRRYRVVVARAAVEDRVAPVLAAASVNGTVLTLTFSEALDTDSKPSAGAFAVTVDGSARTVDAVALSGSAVALTLASAVTSAETVTAGYTVPTGADAAPLQDAAGNAVAGFTDESVSNDTPAPENTAPAGLPEISGTAQVGEMLTASADAITDADGLERASFAWQWLANDGTEDTAIAEATAATYTPKPGDAGKTLTVRVTFTDDKGTEETLTSAATETVAAVAPDAPGGLAASTAEGREGELTVSWTAPESDGGSEVTGYRVQWKSGTEAYDGSEASARQAVVSDPAVLSHTITGLTVGTAYTVRVLAVNAAGVGAAAEVEATVQDRVVPALASASVDGTILTLTFSEALDAASQPTAGAFAVTVDGNARTVDAVALSGSAVELTLASAVTSGETVTVGYTVPTGADAAPLQDAAGNDAASFAGEAVSNDTPAPENAAPAGLPEISGTAQVGETLTASVSVIEDADGLDNATFAYQWLANDGTDDSEIASATGATHEVAPGQAGKTLTVRATFTDDKGNEETLTSAATDTVVDRRPVAATLSVGAGAAEAGRFRLRIAFGDAVTGLALADVTASRVAGGAAAVTELAEAETGRAWTAWVAAEEAGRYTVRLAAGAAEAGERRSLAAVLAVDVDAAGNATAVAGPVVTSVGLAAASDGTWTDGETLGLSLTFSEPVTVATGGGTPTVGIALDGTARQASYASGSGRVAVFTYAVTADDGTVSAASLTADSLAMNGGTIRDAAGRDADLEHPGIGEATEETETESVSALTGLKLVDTGSSTETVLADGDALVLEDPANGSWGLVASVAADAGVGSVVLALTGAKTVTVTDDAAPYSLHGDEDGTVAGAGLPAGSYTLKATAYAEAGGGGAALGTLAVSFTVAASEAADPDALTASFEGVPEVHDGPGSEAFTFQVRFNLEPRVSYAVLRDESFAVTGGEVRKARRVDGRNDLREIHIEPEGWDDVAVMLAGGRACGTRGAICTADDKVLANTAVALVRGPLALNVADARIDEAAGAVLAFEVTLSRAASETVTVDYASADGTATSGADYTAVSGTLTFDAGETAKTVNVTVLDDAHDDTEETLTLTLSNATGARIRDGEATGTIVNSDPIPQAWLARFGRTVAGHVVDAISGRLEGSSGGGSHVTLGGRRLALDGRGDGDGGAGREGTARRGTGETEPARQEVSSRKPPSWEVSSWERGHLARMDTGGPAATGVHSRACGPGGQDARAPRDASRETRLECNDAGASRSPGDDWVHARDAHGTRTMTGRELLLGSAFHLTHGGEADGASTRWTAWGGAASSSFDGEADGLIVDGDVTTFTVGADAARGRWLGGVALAHSTGEGGFRDHDDTGDPNHPGLGSGTLESTLTGVHPYLRFRANERLMLWGILGHGTGELTLAVDASGNNLRKTWKTDTSMEMAAAGARGVVLSAADHDGFELAARGDARLVRMRSEAVTGAAAGAAGAGPLTASESQTSRMRFMLEGSRGIALAGGQALRPSLEVGLRHDGGDAETGTGIELGAGVSYSDPALGLTVEGKARGLLRTRMTDYREWGASGSVRIDPGAAGRGLSLSLSPAWGADTGGAERLWSARDARALAANDAFEPAGRLDAEAGYGLGAFGGRGLMTPFAGLSLSDAGSRTWRSGVRWTLGPDLAFGVEGALRESAGDNAGEHGVAFRLTARW